MRCFGLILALGACGAFYVLEAVAQEPAKGSISGFISGADDGEALIGASVFFAAVEVLQTAEMVVHADSVRTADKLFDKTKVQGPVSCLNLA